MPSNQKEIASKLVSVKVSDESKFTTYFFDMYYARKQSYCRKLRKIPNLTLNGKSAVKLLISSFEQDTKEDIMQRRSDEINAY